MQPATATLDPHPTGHVVAARIAPHALGDFDPMLRRMLGGTQLFIKQADGRWAPRGCQLGLACDFNFADLQDPALRAAA